MKEEYRLFKRKKSKVWYFYYNEGNNRIYKSTGKRLKYEAENYIKEFLEYKDLFHLESLFLDRQAASQRQILFQVHIQTAKVPLGQLHHSQIW